MVPRPGARGKVSRGFAVCLLATATLVASGCGGKKGTGEIPPSETYDPGTSSYTPPPGSEAQRTREMDAKKAEMDRIAQEAKMGEMTPEQMEQAYRDYERERIEMNQASEGSAPPVEAADYPPPPR
jgi:hypothetical protein